MKHSFSEFLQIGCQESIAKFLQPVVKTVSTALQKFFSFLFLVLHLKLWFFGHIIFPDLSQKANATCYPSVFYNFTSFIVKNV